MQDSQVLFQCLGAFRESLTAMSELQSLVWYLDSTLAGPVDAIIHKITSSQFNRPIHSDVTQAKMHTQLVGKCC